MVRSPKHRDLRHERHRQSKPTDLRLMQRKNAVTLRAAQWQQRLSRLYKVTPAEIGLPPRARVRSPPASFRGKELFAGGVRGVRVASPQVRQRGCSPASIIQLAPAGDKNLG